MSNKIYAKDLEKNKGKNIEFAGFVDRIKDLKYVKFIVLRDGTGKVQVTIEKNANNAEILKKLKDLTLESTLNVKGILVDAPSVKMGGMEIIPEQVEITSLAEELPLSYKEQGISRSIRHDFRNLDLRTERNHLIFEIGTAFEAGLRDYCNQHDFIELHSPKITAKAAESGSEVFKLKFFDQDAALSQSPQFYKQMAMSAGFDKVFEIGSAFRAEKSNTNYHAAEINMCDVEVSWVNDIKQIEKLEEEFLKTAFEKINNKYGEVIKSKFKTDLVNVDITIPRISFYEAKTILKEKYNYLGEKNNDFDRKEELLLGKYALDTYKSDFIFVEGFPFESRAFYQQKDNQDNTRSYDLLYRGIEITTGALREHRYDKLIKQIQEKRINLEELKNYLELFRYGCPPHGGFGVGLSRVLMKTLNIDHIMDTNFIYRGPSRKLKL